MFRKYIRKRRYDGMPCIVFAKILVDGSVAFLEIELNKNHENDENILRFALPEVFKLHLDGLSLYSYLLKGGWIDA